jgi:DNA-binding Lrp family transcriptional regulator
MDSGALLRDVALRVGITERAVQQIVADLEDAGVIERMRVGRRNQYVVRRDKAFRHRVEAGVTIGDFIDIVHSGRDRRTARRPAKLLDAGDSLHVERAPC